MAQRKLTYEDYAALPDDGKRYELIDGELVELSSPLEVHQRVLLFLTLEIGVFLRTSPVGKVYFAPFDVTLSDYNTFQPDLLFIANEHLDRLDPARVIGAPTLVVEIPSPSTSRRDRRIKRLRYHEFGVEELWIVDPDAEQIEVYAGDFQTARILQSPDVLTSERLPGLEIAVGDVFAE